jgi:hypothetical protein
MTTHHNFRTCRALDCPECMKVWRSLDAIAAASKERQLALNERLRRTPGEVES